MKIVGIGCAVILAIGLIGAVVTAVKVGQLAKDPKVQAQMGAVACDIALATTKDDAEEFKAKNSRYPKDADELAKAPLKEPFQPGAIDLACEKWSIGSSANGQQLTIEGTPKKDLTGCVITYTHKAKPKFTAGCPKTLSHP